MTCEDDDGAGVAMGGPLGAVMVDYMCQLDQVMGSPDCWLNILGVCEGFSRKQWHVNGCAESGELPCPTAWVGIFQATEGRIEQKGGRRGTALCLTAELRCPLSCPWPGTHTSRSPRGPACRWRRPGLLSLQNRVSRFRVINLLVCFSLSLLSVPFLRGA